MISYKKALINFKWVTVVAAFSIVVILPLHSVKAGTLTASFDGGEGTSTWDQFTGVAGNGWLSSWSFLSNNIVSGTANISTTTPLTTDGGNYVNMSFASPGSGSFSGIGISRKYAGSGGVLDLASNIQYNFVVRCEGSSIGDTRYIFFDASSATNQTGSTCSWVVSGQYGNWILYDGNGAGSYDSTHSYTSVNGEISTIAITKDVSYRFVINVNPTTKLWNVQIYNADTSSLLYDSLATLGDSLGLRSATLGGYFNVAVLDSTPGATSHDDYALSIDSISITQVPEPSIVALLISGGAALLALPRFRQT